jgi:hypothetical protein
MSAGHGVEAKFTAAPSPGPVPRFTPPAGSTPAIAPLLFDATSTTSTEPIATFEWKFEGGEFGSCPADEPLAYHSFTH